MSRSIPAIAVAVLLVGLPPATSAPGADLTITESNSPVLLAAGGTGTLDFTIASTSNDTLSSFGLELQITPVGTPTSLLQFTSTQSDPYSNLNYVFYGESTNQDLNLPFWGPATQTIYISDTITGGDSDDGSDAGFVTIPATPTGAHSYLATVQFQGAAGSVDRRSVPDLARPAELRSQQLAIHVFRRPEW